MTDLIDRLRIHYHFRRRVGRFPNLRDPRTFTEKIQKAKLTWRSPRMVALADKVVAKRIVAELLGDDWVTPNYFAGADLPPREARDWPLPYVIKINHRSGGNIFVRTEADRDWKVIERQVSRWLRSSYGTSKVEWVYRAIPRQVLVEPYFGGDHPPPDFRLHVFDGRVEFTSVNWERFAQLKRANYDRDWNRVDFVIGNHVPFYGDGIPDKPGCYDEMAAAAEKLAAGFPFARADFYVIDGRPRFGEVTFYPDSGMFQLEPELDAHYGALWPDWIPS